MLEGSIGWCCISGMESGEVAEGLNGAPGYFTLYDHYGRHLGHQQRPAMLTMNWFALRVVFN